MLAVHLFFIQFNEIANSFRDWVARVHVPNAAVFAVFPPFEITGSAHEFLEYFREMSRMQHNKTHAFKNPFMHAIHDFIPHFIMRHMSPPDQDIGVLQYFFRQAMLRFVQSRCLHLELVFAQELRQLPMDALRIHVLNGLVCFLMPKFVPYGYLNHGYLSLIL
ncbi:hypothetical protein D3C81_1370720 [compost metagenome]